MIDIKDLIKSRYAQDSDLKKSFDMPVSISKRILRKSCRKLKKIKVSKEILISLIASAQAAEYRNNSIDYFMNAVIDASLAMQNLINSAE